MADNAKLEKLIKLNWFAGALHFVQAIAILFIAKEFLLPVSTSYLAFNESTKSLEPASQALFNVSLPGLIAIFFMLSALAHLVIVTVYKKKYLSDLKRGINYARWVEYSLSASIMMVAIALLVGVYDAAILLSILALTAIMNLCGMVMEVHNQTTKSTNWLSFWIGSLAGIVPWLIILLYFIVSAANGSAPPAFVYGIFVSIFIFFNCFAINMALQYKKLGKWKDYLYGEKAYIVLSLVAKSALAWQVFGGTLQP